MAPTASTTSSKAARRERSLSGPLPLVHSSRSGSSAPALSTKDVHKRKRKHGVAVNVKIFTDDCSRRFTVKLGPPSKRQGKTEHRASSAVHGPANDL